MSKPASKCLPRGAVTFPTRSQNSNCLNYSRDSQGAAAPGACVAISKELRAKPEEKNSKYSAVSGSNQSREEAGARAADVGSGLALKLACIMVRLQLALI